MQPNELATVHDVFTNVAPQEEGTWKAKFCKKCRVDQPPYHANVPTTKGKANLPRRLFPFNFFTFCMTLILVAVCTSTAAHSNQLVLRPLHVQTVEARHMMFFLIVTTSTPTASKIY